MATANSIITPQAPFNAFALTSAANTNYQAPTASVLLLAAIKDTRLTRIISTGLATNTALNLQLYLSKDAGVTKSLITTRLVTAFTVAATTALPTQDFGFSDANPLFLVPGDSLYIAQSVTNTIGFAWYAEWATY